MKNILHMFLFLSLSGILHAQPDTLDWNTFNVPVVGDLDFIEGNHTYDFTLIDIDHDQVEEAVIFRRDNDYPFQIAVREIFSESYTLLPRQLHINNPNEKRPYMLFPLSDYPKGSFAVYDMDSENGILKIYNNNLEVVDSIMTLRGYSKEAYREWNGYMAFLRMVDINSDARKDLVYIINTASDGQPRVLHAFDVHTKEKLLDLQFAPMIQDYIITDLEGDGDVEIVIELIGAGDGPQFGPFKRNESYVAVYDHRGKLLKYWEHAGPATYMASRIYDMNNDGIKDIIITMRALAETKLPSIIQIINGKTLESEAIHQYEFDQNRYAGIYWIDKSSEGEVNFAVYSQNKKLRWMTYEPKSKLIKENRIVPFADLALHSKLGEGYYYDDINGDGEDEYFIPDRFTNRIWIIQKDFTPLAYIQLDKVHLFALHSLSSSTNQTKKYILYNDYKLYRLILDVNEVFSPPALSVNLGWLNFKLEHSLTLLLFYTVIFIIILTIFLLFKQKKSLYYAALFNSSHVAAFLLDKKKRIRWANSHFLQMLQASRYEIRKQPYSEFLEKNKLTPLARQINLFVKSEKPWEHKEIQIGNHENSQSVALELHRTRQGHIQGMFVDSAKSIQAERIHIWSAMAQRIVHKTKTPLGTVMLAIQRLQRTYYKESPKQAEQYDNFVNAAISEIARVRDDINTFMKFARLNEPVLQMKEIKHFLRNSIELYERRLPEGIHIEQELDPEKFTGQIDESQFQEALFNLIDNGITAMENKGLMKIVLTYDKDPLNENYYANIDIIDQGKGIEEKDLKNIFDSGFTTSSQSTGMGLLIAKNIIEQHQGEIHVHSRVNIGSTFTVRLPVVSEVINES